MRPSSPPLSTGHDTLSPASQTAIEDQEKQSPTWVIPVAQHILPHPPTQLMARRMDEESQGGYSSSDSLPTRIPAEPLILDDSPMEDEENEAIEDLEEEIVRQRVNAARALFHRPPCENDTQYSPQSLYLRTKLIDFLQKLNQIFIRYRCGVSGYPRQEILWRLLPTQRRR